MKKLPIRIEDYKKIINRDYEANKTLPAREIPGADVRFADCFKRLIEEGYIKSACIFRNDVICYPKFYRNGDKKHVFYRYTVYSPYDFSMADFSYYGHRLILTDCRMRMAVGRKVLFGYAGIGIIREPHGIYTLVYVAGRFFFYIQVSLAVIGNQEGNLQNFKGGDSQCRQSKQKIYPRFSG